ncbi:MAG: hypothetical protein JKY81_00055 [Colwellia sp.]|nr:hypothetical protein [Colwellia sp.]
MQARDGWLFIRQEDIGTLAGKSRGTVSASITKLVKCGHMEKRENINGGQGANFYKIVHDGSLPPEYDRWQNVGIKIIQEDKQEGTVNSAVKSLDSAVKSANSTKAENTNNFKAVDPADSGPFSLESIRKDSKTKTKELVPEVDEVVLNIVSTFMAYRTLYFPKATAKLNIRNQVNDIQGMLDKGASSETLLRVIEEQMPLASKQYAETNLVPNTIRFFKNELKKKCPEIYDMHNSQNGDLQQKEKYTMAPSQVVRSKEAKEKFCESVSALVPFQANFAFGEIRENKVQLFVNSKMLKGIIERNLELSQICRKIFGCDAEYIVCADIRPILEFQATV